jgi:pimeloyl-ACP methyl ester carboxylesterase
VRLNLLKKSFFAVGLFFTMSIFWGCSQESLIFYPEKLPANFKFSFSIPFDDIALQVNGGTINALLFKSDKPQGVVLYFHGNAGSLRTWGEVAAAFTTRGYDILIPDYRGFGKSSGQIKDEDTLLQDGAAAYTYLAGHYPENRIVIYGRSIGTGIATYIAKTKRPKMLILESPYFNLIDLAVHHYPFVPAALMKAFLKYPLRNDLWINHVQCPIVIFHGAKDDIIPYNASERLFKLLGGRGQLIRVDNGGHNDLGDSALYQRRLDTILR